MPEAAILEDLRNLLEQAQLSIHYRELVARWMAEGLPEEPVDGSLGAEQLREAVTVLRQLSVEIASVQRLPDLLGTPRIRFAGLAESDDQTADELRAPVDYSTDWPEQLNNVARTIDRYLNNGDRS